MNACNDSAAWWRARIVFTASVCAGAALARASKAVLRDDNGPLAHARSPLGRVVKTSLAGQDSHSSVGRPLAELWDSALFSPGAIYFFTGAPEGSMIRAVMKMRRE